MEEDFSEFLLFEIEELLMKLDPTLNDFRYSDATPPE